MASGFDDHPTVVALQFVMNRLIFADCRREDDPDVALAKWLRGLETQRDLYVQAAAQAQRPEAAINAVMIATEFDTLAKELTSAAPAEGLVPPEA